MVNALIKAKDMDDQVLEKVIDLAEKAANNNETERDIAKEIKEQMDEEYNPCWHVVVGESFGSFVTHETNCFAYFYLGSRAFLIFKAGSL